MVVLFLGCINPTTAWLLGNNIICIICLTPPGKSNGGQSADAVLAMKVHG